MGLLSCLAYFDLLPASFHFFFGFLLCNLVDRLSRPTHEWQVRTFFSQYFCSPFNL